MGILNIRPAVREGSRLVLGIAGISGSGKTRTALEIGYGLANYDAKKLGFLDTENRRGSLYADALKNAKGEVQPFLIADLDAPFSPARYKQAILEFQAAGVEVLVIDSISHEWEGQGGCHEIASPPGANLKIKKWNDAKEQHKSMMNALLQCDMHIIVCVRARDKVELNTAAGKVEYIKLGVLPIQEPNFMFEMTASMMMWDSGKAQETLKAHEDLLPHLGRGKGFITAADGKAVRDWVDGAKKLNPEIERARNMLRTTTEQGLAALSTAWRGLPADIKRVLGPAGCPVELKASAEEFDKQRAAAKVTDEGLADLNIRLSGVGTAQPDLEAQAVAMMAEVNGCNDYQAFQPIEERASALIDQLDNASRQDMADQVNDALKAAHTRFAPASAAA